MSNDTEDSNLNIVKAFLYGFFILLSIWAFVEGKIFHGFLGIAILVLISKTKKSI